MKRNTPTRIVETGRVARGSSGQPTGWLQPLVERARNLKAQIVGVQERIATPLRDGFPSMVQGEMTFKADLGQQISIENYPIDGDATVPTFATPLLVNPIMLAGITYRIPVLYTPPGVLHAHNLVVGIEAGFTTYGAAQRPGITPLNDYRQTIPNLVTSNGAMVSGAPNLRAMRWTYQQQVLGDFAQVMPFLPF